MPLWKKTTTICVALFVSAPFASESIAQRLSPLTPLPMPAVSAADNAPRSIFEAAPAAPLAQAPSARQPSPLTNPFKPMATPGAPIVKLATRPVYQPNPRVSPVASVKHIPANKINQAELGRLLAISASSTAKETVKQLTKPAKSADIKPLTQFELPKAITKVPKMLKTQSSSMLSPLPKSSFVSTSKTAVALTNDFPLAATTPSVVVRSPFVQPGNPNRYLFVVENIGTVDAVSTRVDLRVPAGVVLKQVVADSASSTARHAIVRIDDLKAGAKAILEVEIQPTTVDVTFDTSLTLETKRSFQGLTLPEKGGASSLTTATASTSPATPDLTQNVNLSAPESIDVAPTIAGKGNLSATVEGPVLLAADQTGNFSIVVKNPNYQDASSIIVQLAIPQGLKVTTLDREAWVNDQDNTISWEMASLGARQEVTIQYKAVGKSFGQQVQKVTLGMEDVYQGDAQLVTLVSQ